ncbi:MAG TPA: hypothetical protein VGB85_33070 [Nannocystis sp.]|jgi:CheY-like chemotaxis protein
MTGATTSGAPQAAPRVLVAHERPVLARAIQQVLAAQGMQVEVMLTGDAVARALQLQTWDALVLDVGLPGPPVHQLATLAKTGGSTAVKALVLVTSVFRRGSYKRPPQQLYGADDYVEVHQLGAKLPGKLWRLLAGDAAGPDGMLEAEALLIGLQASAGGDTLPRLATLLVADAVLHNGDRLADADTPEQARDALASELAQARGQYHEVVGATPNEVDPIDAAFDALVRGRGEEAGAWT